MRLNFVFWKQNLRLLMSESEILTLFPYEWVVKDEYTDDNRIAIHVWCLDQNSKPCFLRIEDFPVLCYIELPMIVQGQYRQWNNDMARRFMKYLNYRLKDHAAIGYSLRYMKKTYYYRGKITYPMLLLKFKTLNALRHCENILKYTLNTMDFGYLKCNIWECKIPTIRKLLTNQGMSYSQWFTVRGEKVEPDLRISSLDDEYIIQWKTMNPVPMEICDKWRIYPRMLAFDIECYSDNNRVFPDAWCVKHVVYMVSCIFQVYNHLETRKRYAIILGPCADIPEEKLCNTEIIHVKTEEELVNAFAELILSKDPEIITGYNIFGFDYKYLHVRLIQQLCEWPVMGRILGEKATMKEQEWSSGAYGHQIIYDLKMDGRINIDLLPIIKRDYKLLKYTLDFVAGHFLGSHKHDITAPDMFWIYEELQESEKWFKRLCNENTSDKISKIVNQLEQLFSPCLWRSKTEVFDLYNKRDEFINVHYKKYNEATQVEEKVYPFLNTKEIFKILKINEYFFKENEIDKISLLRFVLALELMTFVLMYCIQDSELVLDLIERLNIFLGLVQMSNVTGVSIVELFTRGQQLRCMSLLYDIAAKQGYVIDGAAKPGYKYTGGFVYTPIPGLHENVMCWDFSSLYPTIIMAYNIDYTTLVHSTFEDKVPDEICNIIEFTQEEEVTTEKEEPEIVTKKYRFKYLNADKTGIKGLLPQLEQKLVASRRAVRNMLKTEKDPIMRIVYNQRQLAIKVVCNSFYGFLGVQRGGVMPLIEGAMSITAKARQSILTVSDYVKEKHGGIVVYGDSVTGDTPILIRDKYSKISIIPISILYQDNWVSHCGKEYSIKIEDLEVWSDKGFTPIKHIMRHKTKKRIYRITTNTGIVKVTEDHSLLDEYAEKIKPSEIKCGDRLLTSHMPILSDDGIEIKEAWVWGLFYVDGFCGSSSWVISNQDLSPLERAKDILERVYTNNHFKIKNAKKSSNLHKLVAKGDIDELVDEWRKLFYDLETTHKKVPNILWSSSKKTRQDFYQGYIASNNKKECNKEQIGLAGLFFLAHSIGYKLTFNTKGKLDIHRSTLIKINQHPGDKGSSDIVDPKGVPGSAGFQGTPGTINKIEDLGLIDDYVYDLETQNHHFSAGIGELVVHNTDSVMADLGIKDPLEAVKKGKELEKELSDLFPDPMNMELEKVMRILSLKKKRYIYAEVDNKTGKLKLDLKDLKYKGIEIARRDRPKWLRDIQGAVIQKIIRFCPFTEALDLVIEAIDKLLAGKVPYQDLITVKGLNASYKNKSYHMAVFAEELKKIGKPAQAGSRIEYLVVKDEKNVLLGQKQRLPETYLERIGTDKEEKLDYLYYIEKIMMNPISQLLKIAYKDTIEKLSNIKFRPTKRHKFVGLDEPILLIFRMIKYGQDYHQLQEAVKFELKPKKPPRLHLNVIPITNK